MSADPVAYYCFRDQFIATSFSYLTTIAQSNFEACAFPFQK